MSILFSLFCRGGLAMTLLLGCMAGFSPVLAYESIQHIDFEGPRAAYVYRSRNSGSLQISEYDDAARERRNHFIAILGSGRPPEIIGEAHNHFARFASGASTEVKDRTEFVLSRTLRDDRTYMLDFDIRLPRDGSGNTYYFPGENDWFIITQVLQMDVGPHSPAMSINLRRAGDDLFLHVIGRNDEDRYERLITLPLTDSRYFAFDEWRRFQLRFRMGSAGRVELWTHGGSSRREMRQVGAAAHRLAFDDRSTDYMLRMGLYRGSGPRGAPDRTAYFVDFDNVALSAR